MTEQAFDAIRGRARTLALIVVICAMVMDIVDLTIVNVAIPTLQATLHVGQAESQWLVAGYATVFAIFLISGGRLGDIFGYRRMLLGGMGAFAVASLGCGLAQDATALVLARLAQGVAASVMLPQVSSLVQVMYRPEERVGALSLFGVMGGAAAVSGPVLGGLIIGADLFGLGWRPIFLINLPIAVATIAAGLVLLPQGRSAHSPRLDWPGTALAMLTVAAVMVPLVQGREHGWPAWSLLMLAASLPSGLLLFGYSRRRMARDGSALVVPGLFADRGYATGVAMATLFQSGLTGLLFALTQAFQNGLGFSAETVGLVHMPYAAGSSISIGFLVRRALPRFGAKVISAGGLAMAGGLGLLCFQFGHDVRSPWAFAPTMLAMGLGMGLMTGPLGPITLSEVDRAQAGAASGLFKALQEFGGALGVAVSGGLYLSLVARGRPALGAFTVSALLIGASFVAVALIARAVPRRLRVFGGGMPSEQPVLPTTRTDQEEMSA